MTSPKNLSFAHAAIPLRRLFAGKLEPQRRPVEDIYAAAGRSSRYTDQENRIWLRSITAELVSLGLVTRVRPGGKNTSVSHIRLTAKGEQVLSDTLAQEQQDAMASRPAQDDSRPTPTPLTQQDVPTLDSIMRNIKRFCELHGCKFELTITPKDCADSN